MLQLLVAEAFPRVSFGVHAKLQTYCIFCRHLQLPLFLPLFLRCSPRCCIFLLVPSSFLASFSLMDAHDVNGLGWRFGVVWTASICCGDNGSPTNRGDNGSISPLGCVWQWRSFICLCIPLNARGAPFSFWASWRSQFWFLLHECWLVCIGGVTLSRVECLFWGCPSLRFSWYRSLTFTHSSPRGKQFTCLILR